MNLNVSIRFFWIIIFQTKFKASINSRYKHEVWINQHIMYIDILTLQVMFEAKHPNSGFMSHYVIPNYWL